MFRVGDRVRIVRGATGHGQIGEITAGPCPDFTGDGIADWYNVHGARYGVTLPYRESWLELVRDEPPKPKRTRRELAAKIRAAIGTEDLDDDMYWQHKPYTHVQVSYYERDRDAGWVGHGFSKWNPNDNGVPGQDWNPVCGIAKARGRAIADLLDQMATEEGDADE